ncbi:Ankyrin repeat domain containing hypothetical protein 31 [Phytophthora palmivora]|uniref:Uncharacterized protein n=1 Tax=Phytophthora palmivora TaxID=4796 RepID=A0A2P4YAP5_9STRA|nr:Ankyrin repeat domain containing hypothetical protein 31 [Phytophthora palmivora]
MEVLLKLGADPNLRNEQNRTPLEELEATMPTSTTENNDSNFVTSARLPDRPGVYREPIPTRPESKLALQPIRRGSYSTERTDVRDFMSRRSVTEYSDRCDHHPEIRSSGSNEPGQWATAPKPVLTVPTPQVQSTPVRKTLRYAGKRVIMAIRVKSALVDTEKLELMRLLLQKHISTPVQT